MKIMKVIEEIRRTTKEIKMKKYFRDETSHCMFYLLDMASYNVHGITFLNFKDAYIPYFSIETISQTWMIAKANKYIIPIGDSQKYLLGVRGLMSEWGQFL